MPRRWRACATRWNHLARPALARVKRTVQEFVGVKSKYGRADVYATWQMMELAWGQRDTARTRSLARKIILDFPAEVGE